MWYYLRFSQTIGKLLRLSIRVPNQILVLSNRPWSLTSMAQVLSLYTRVRDGVARTEPCIARYGLDNNATLPGIVRLPSSAAGTIDLAIWSLAEPPEDTNSNLQTCQDGKSFLSRLCCSSEHCVVLVLEEMMTGVRSLAWAESVGGHVYHTFWCWLR